MKTRLTLLIAVAAAVTLVLSTGPLPAPDIVAGLGHALK